MAELAPVNTRQAWTTKEGLPTQYFYEFINKLWERSGGADDLVSDADATETTSTILLAKISAIAVTLEEATDAVLSVNATLAARISALESQIEDLEAAAYGA